MITVEGIIEEIIFCNEINGYTVCEIKNNKNVITAVGYMPFINEGENIKVTGKWVNHPDYGEQLKVEVYEKILPQTADAIERYLSSGVVKGVGPATAKKIVKRFGEDSLHIIENHPEKLSEVKGITLEKALMIGEIFNEQRELRRVVLFFHEYGISPTYAAKIYKQFGDSTIEEIKKNPYRLVDEAFGINFKAADKVARSLGIDPASKYRICSGIKYVLTQFAANGHTYMTEEKLKEHASNLLEIQISSIEDALVSLLLDKSICVEKNDTLNKVYLSSFYHAELGVCRKLIELSSVVFDQDLSDFDRTIKEVQEIEGITLAPKQVEAIREALVNGVLVITGGPGTGKTTIIKSIIKLLTKEGYDVVLAAPTGRAAKRMTEAAGCEARTIHRLLEIGYTSEEDELSFVRGESYPIDADVIIIDEMSMVDIILMNNLLKAVVQGTRLILVGDVDQLPSVGAGNVLKDILQSEVIKSVRLSEIFRQAEESMIVVNAHRINKGEAPCLNMKGKDFFFQSLSSGPDVAATIVDLCSKRLPQSFGFDPVRHIQVLTPTRKGPVGVTNLNIELQKVLNPSGFQKSEKVFYDYIFREGDKVMQVKNNYNLRWERTGDKKVEGVGVFNGDTGIIHTVDNEEQKITVMFEDDKIVEYDFSILDEIEPAFAVTVHKSQGSEFPAVVMPITQGPQVLMTRNLLYTAVTRARELVVLVGSKPAMLEMVNNEREALRNSGLAEKLKKCCIGLYID